MSTALVNFVKEAHGDQMYGDVPYWHHLRDVKKMTHQILHEDTSATFRKDCNDAAWCHDVIEDTQIMFNQLEKVVGDSVASAVFLLSQGKLQSREDYIWEMTENAVMSYSARLALVVKIADSMCNLRETLKAEKPNLRRVMKYTSNLSEMIPVAKRLNLLKPKRFL